MFLLDENKASVGDELIMFAANYESDEFGLRMAVQCKFNASGPTSFMYPRTVLGVIEQTHGVLRVSSELGCGPVCRLLNV